MRKLTRNLAAAVAAGLLATGAVLPAMAQDTEPASTEPVTTDHEPQQTRAQTRRAVREPAATPEERLERLAEREVFRAERDEQHRERVTAAVEAGHLTEEQAQEMREAREQRADRGVGQRGPVARPGAGEGPRGPIAGGRGGGGMGPMDGSGPNEDCPLDAQS